MSDTTHELSNLHTPFFILYIVTGVVFLMFHFRFIIVIQKNKSLVKLPAFRIIQHDSIACSINIVSQIVAVASTLADYNMNYTLNWINGAIFQGSWAVEYPMILILAANRLLSVAYPMTSNRIFDLSFANGMVGLCWGFGIFNAVICLLGQVQSIWIATVPGFAFTSGTALADFISYMDFYFAEFVILSSLICYISIFMILSKKHNAIRSIKVELPLILHFGTIFALTAAVLYLWHYPPCQNDLYGHIFNLFVLLRFCVSPVLALLTNESIRERFFCRKLHEDTKTIILKQTNTK
ncbi:hypothetical protein RB195_017317 [Necator americanus]|uniref:7TM GPCR serpentine receptor class x (Srx) domain-containing protein n=1 Tax=Necator americanus TaxID=51031 RepID=A0ABR1C764_NECAM